MYSSSSRQQALHFYDSPPRPPSRRGFRIIKQTEALLNHSNNEVPRRSNAPSPEAHISIAGFDGLVDCRDYDIRDFDIRPKMRQS